MNIYIVLLFHIEEATYLKCLPQIREVLLAKVIHLENLSRRLVGQDQGEKKGVQRNPQALKHCPK